MILPDEYIVPVNDHEQIHAVLVGATAEHESTVRDFADGFTRAEAHLDFNSMIRCIEDACRNAGDRVQGRVSL